MYSTMGILWPSNMAMKNPLWLMNTDLQMGKSSMNGGFIAKEMMLEYVRVGKSSTLWWIHSRKVMMWQKKIRQLISPLCLSHLGISLGKRCHLQPHELLLQGIPRSWRASGAFHVGNGGMGGLLTWLVAGPPLWKIWTSIGMISNPIYGKVKMATKPPTSNSCYGRHSPIANQHQ